MAYADQDAIKMLAARAVLARTTPGGVPSPCISVCTMDWEGKLCQGCWRNIDEIAAWSRCDDAQKRAIWDRIAKRLANREAGSL